MTSPTILRSLSKPYATEENDTMRYSIKNDGYGLIYQWDELFGTVIIYPENVTEAEAVDFLSKYIKV